MSAVDTNALLSEYCSTLQKFAKKYRLSENAFYSWMRVKTETSRDPLGKALPVPQVQTFALQYSRLKGSWLALCS